MAKKGGISVKKIGSLPITTAESKYLRNSPKTVQEIAENSLNHFLEGFRRGGKQTDESRDGWQRRKDNTGSGGRAILVKTGALRRDLDVMSLGRDRIVIGTRRVKYAAVHNEGLKIPDRYPVRRKAMKFKVGGKTVFTKFARGFTMPKREFIGHSDTLNQKNLISVKELLDNALKS